MKCPMKFADGALKPSHEGCEREACAWWVAEVSGRPVGSCAVRLLSVMSLASTAASLVGIEARIEFSE